ncbi:transporter [Wenjunlia vitaminophila]|uniref:Transporter n=1 Tax=Wenjunlia vitaminophila TaxID=76728 RepID=A0A0T6LTE9_WENVI|nr:MFS transporter [Wenjunlia vitaminophila]KRV49318.1 transporter [Wenjunlia vitaminophila]
MQEDSAAGTRTRESGPGRPDGAVDRPAVGAGAEGPTVRRAPGVRWLVMVGLVVAAVNLRPAVTSLGALMEEVRDGLGMSGTVAGMLTSVPALCFAVFGGLAPRLARRSGPAAVVGAGLVAITAGLAVRAVSGGTALFLLFSAVALAGIAVSNVLLPVIVKRWFPDRIGPMTGLYSMALALGTSTAAAVTVPMADALGGSWRLGLGSWAVLAAVAVLPWAVIVLRARTEDRARPEDGPRPAVPAFPISRSRTAWALAVFFGLQATGAYITMGWLPQIFRDAGVSAGQAGVLLAVTMGMGVPLAFVLPAMAARYRNQGGFVVGLGLFGIVGYLGLALAPAQAPWVWAVLLGVSNCSFPLALTMVGLRARSAVGVGKLSAFAQSVGYLISIPGPIAVGALYDHSGDWDLPIALIAALLLPQVAAGVLAGRAGHVEDQLRRRPVSG